MELKRLQALVERKAIKPDLCLFLEEHFGKKFNGPYSDGREWDMKITFKNPVEMLDSLTKMVKKINSKFGDVKDDNSIKSSIAFKINKQDSIGLDFETNKTLLVTVFNV